MRIVTFRSSRFRKSSNLSVVKRLKWPFIRWETSGWAIPMVVTCGYALEERSAGAPADFHTAPETKAAFIHKDQRTPLPLSLFFSSSHSVVRQYAICASSRWAARSPGRCADSRSSRPRNAAASRPASRPPKELSISALDFLTAASMRWAVRPMPPGGKMQSNSPPTLTAYFFVKMKFSSIFVLTSRMWVKYRRKPPL